MSEPITASVAETRKDLGDLLSRAHYQNERIVVTKRDKPFANLVSVKDGEKLNAIDAMAKRFGIPSEEMLTRIETALANQKEQEAACSS